jgi:hypothetical protein
MVVQTRSSRVKFTTPSFREASARSYKVYTPRITAAAAAAAAASAERAHTREEPVDDERDHDHDDDSDVSYIAEAMVELQGTRKNMVITEHKCLNPMTPITRYAYSIQVYNSEKNVHYRSAYILYDNTTRLYTIYSIISNIFIASPHDSVAADHHSHGHGDAAHKLPNPVHTVHT